MKRIQLLTHPYILIIAFCFIIVSGQQMGGLYLLYLLLGITHGASYSWVAMDGIAMLLFSNYRYKNTEAFAQIIVNICGVILLLLSLFFFFYEDKNNYNSATFTQTIPIISLVIFGTIAVYFLVHNLIRRLK